MTTADQKTTAEEPLHPSQTAAIAHIRNQALMMKQAAYSDMVYCLRMGNVLPSKLDSALEAIDQHARIAIHFHPDRPAQAPKTNVTSGDDAITGGERPQVYTVAHSLLDDGLFRSQFETGISNGSVSAWPGGMRDDWERRLFAGAYHTADQGWQPALRPKYGALDLMRHPDGPAPRFGSCYFVLRPAVSARSTFTFGGSQDDPKCRGTVDVFEHVLDQLLAEAFTRDFALGVHGIRPAGVVDRILGLNKPLEEVRTEVGVQSRNLDHIIEAQVHGQVRLNRDIELLVADPSFRGTGTGKVLQEMSDKYGFVRRWHPGCRMAAPDVPLDFRGPTMPSLAERIAEQGILDASIVGKAVQDLTRDPEVWNDRGTFAEVLQELKLLWHVLVRYGDPVL